MSSAKEFKQLLDQIASPSNGTDPQWVAITNIVELVKQKEIGAKKASQEIRKKLLDANENTVLQTLYLVDSIVKNTPSGVHKDFLSSELLAALKAVVEGQGPSMAKAVDKVLEMLGEWKAAFGDDTTYKNVKTTFNELEKGGYFIPEATLASASYMQKPPPFQEADKCFLCGKEFGKSFIKGRHHCRNCGKSICGKCQGESNVPLPQFGITEPQRVCITCYKKIDKPSEQGDSKTSDIPNEYLNLLGGEGSGNTSGPTSSSQTNPGQGSSNRELQMQEEEDLQMAIAMSLNEEENKKSSSSSSKPSSSVPPTSAPSQPQHVPPPSQPLYTPLYADLDFSAAPSTSVTQQYHPPTTIEQQSRDDELQRYLDYGRQRKEEHSVPQSVTGQKEESSDSFPFCTTLRSLIDQFNKRMQYINERGSSIATDQAVLTMHQNLSAMNLQLLQQMDEGQEKKVHLEAILHKLEEAKEARVTLDTMRRRHQEQLIIQEREQAALAQMQVQMKLALLRQQKAEQLAYGQSLQAERLGRLSNQREEYERSLATQREAQRNQLIVQEQQIFDQQFGNTSSTETAPYTMSQGPPYTAGYSSQSQPLVHQETPLPTKVDPPPYQAPPSLYQPSLYNPQPTIDNMEYHHTSTLPSGPPPPLVPSGPPIDVPVNTYHPSHEQQYVPPQSFTGSNLSSSSQTQPQFTGIPSYQPVPNQLPMMTGLPAVPPTTLLQRPPSEPPLISFD